MSAQARLALLLAILTSIHVAVFSRQSASAPESQATQATGADSLDGWKEFSPTGGGFKVLVPRAPRETTGEIKVGDLIVKTHTYSVQDSAAYAVMYFDVPHVADDRKLNGELLAGIRDFVLAELKGKLLNDRPVTLDNNPGRLLEISMPKGGIARAMIIVAGHRLYRITAAPLKRDAQADYAERVSLKYLESFKLMPVDRLAEGEVDRYLRENPELVRGLVTRGSDNDSGAMLNGKALSLPRPEYNATARAAHASGTVIVQLIIDEEGKVIAAQAINGHPLLLPSAVEAARKARFSPTQKDGKPVKVYGKIFYTFAAL